RVPHPDIWIVVGVALVAAENDHSLPVRTEEGAGGRPAERPWAEWEQAPGVPNPGSLGHGHDPAPVRAERHSAEPWRHGGPGEPRLARGQVPRADAAVRVPHDQ